MNHSATHPKFWERTNKPLLTRDEHLERLRMLSLEAQQDETVIPLLKEAVKEAQQAGAI